MALSHYDSTIDIVVVIIIIIINQRYQPANHYYTAMHLITP